MIPPFGAVKDPRMAWCLANFVQGKWKVAIPGGRKNLTFLFTRSEDATLFALRWSDG